MPASLREDGTSAARTQRQTCVGTGSWDACGHQQLGVGVWLGLRVRGGR